jgi:hypothetical protein
MILVSTRSRRRTVPSSPVCRTLVLQLLLLLSLVALSAAESAIATVIRTPADVLPARVMMASARDHASASSTPTPTRIAYYLPDALCPRALLQLSADGVEVLPLSAVALPPGSPPLTYTRLFDETRFDSILYLMPEALVLEDISPITSCPVLCAAFIMPCSFSTGVMVITPNSTTYARIMDEWPVEICGNLRAAPDGLDPESCALNELFGKELMSAPLFDIPGQPPIGGFGDTANQSKSLMRRLPMGCHTMHYLFYPRLRFEVPRESCGLLRIIDFKSPSPLRPWLWWTYAIFDLSWEWLSYRNKLSDPSSANTPSRLSVWLRVIVFSAVAVAIVLIWRPTRPTGAATNVQGPSTNGRPTLSFRLPLLEEHIFLLIALGGALVMWLISLILALSWTPPTLLPQDAIPLFATYKTLAFTVLLLCHGRFTCATQALPCDNISHDSSAERCSQILTSERVVRETAAWALGDVAAGLIVAAVAGRLPVGTIYERILALLPLGCVYFYILVAGMTRVCMMWLAWGAVGMMPADSYVGNGVGSGGDMDKGRTPVGSVDGLPPLPPGLTGSGMAVKVPLMASGGVADAEVPDSASSHDD